MVSQLHIEYYNDTGKTETFIYHKFDVQKKMAFHMTNYAVALHYMLEKSVRALHVTGQ